MREVGVIKTFVASRGFGFIQRQGEADIFFHISEVNDDNIYESETLENLSVSFILEKGDDGRYKAVDVRSA